MNKHVVAYLYKRKYPVIVGLSCTTLCDPIDCSLPGFSIHGIFHTGGLPNPGIEPGSPVLWADFLLFEPPEKQLLSNKMQCISVPLTFPSLDTISRQMRQYFYSNAQKSKTAPRFLFKSFQAFIF